jgi:hypothetical protein
MSLVLVSFFNSYATTEKSESGKPSSAIKVLEPIKNSKATIQKWHWSCCCVAISLGGSLGYVSAGVEILKFCCHDTYTSVDCGLAIIHRSNDPQGLTYDYAGIQMRASQGTFQMDENDYSNLVNNLHNAVNNSGLSVSDQAAALAQPLTVHLETALEVTFDDLPNSLVFMPGDYTVDNDRNVTFNIGVVTP